MLSQRAERGRGCRITCAQHPQGQAGRVRCPGGPVGRARRPGGPVGRGAHLLERLQQRGRDVLHEVGVEGQAAGPHLLGEHVLLLQLGHEFCHRGLGQRGGQRLLMPGLRGAPGRARRDARGGGWGRGSGPPPEVPRWSPCPWSCGRQARLRAGSVAGTPPRTGLRVGVASEGAPAAGRGAGRCRAAPLRGAFPTKVSLPQHPRLLCPRPRPHAPPRPRAVHLPPSPSGPAPMEGSSQGESPRFPDSIQSPVGSCPHASSAQDPVKTTLAFAAMSVGEHARH